jgi:hypothetical protein
MVNLDFEIIFKASEDALLAGTQISVHVVPVLLLLMARAREGARDVAREGAKEEDEDVVARARARRASRAMEWLAFNVAMMLALRAFINFKLFGVAWLFGLGLSTVG